MQRGADLLVDNDKALQLGSSVCLGSPPTEPRRIPIHML